MSKIMSRGHDEKTISDPMLHKRFPCLICKRVTAATRYICRVLYGNSLLQRDLTTLISIDFILAVFCLLAFRDRVSQR